MDRGWLQNHGTYKAAIVLGLVALFFPAVNTHFAPDSISYLLEASRLARLEGYGDVYRGPGFPVIAAVVMMIAGPTSDMLLLIPRMFYAILLLVFAGYATRLFGFWPAVVGMIYVATAPLIFVAGSKFHVDIAVAAWGLCAVWLQYEGYRRSSLRWCAAGGAVLALGFLTKEIAMVLLPLWVIAFIAFPPYSRRHIRLAAAGLGSFGALVAPWALIVTLNTGQGSVLGKHMATSGKFSAFLYRIMTEPVEFVLSIPQELASFWEIYFLSSNVDGLGLYGYAALAATLGLLVITILQRKTAQFYVLLSIVALFPIMLYFADQGVRLRQTTLIFAIHAVSVPALVAGVRDVLARSQKRIAPESRFWQRSVVASPIFAMVCALLVLGSREPAVQKLFTADVHSFGMAHPTTPWFSPTGKYRVSMRNAADWLHERVDTSDNVLTAYRRNAKLLEVFMSRNIVGNAVQKHNLKHWRQLYLHEGAAGAKKAVTMSSGPSSGGPGNLLFFWHNRDNGWKKCLPNVKPEMPLARASAHFCKTYFVTEQALFRKIRKRNVKYVTVGEQMRFMRDYFEQSRSFHHAASFRSEVPPDGRNEKQTQERIDVFRVAENLDPVDEFRPVLSYNIPHMVGAYRSVLPVEFDVWREQVLVDTIGLDRENYKRVLAGDLKCFKFAGAESQVRPCAMVDLARDSLTQPEM